MGRIFIKKNFRLYNRIVNYTVTISQFGRCSIRSPLESLDEKVATVAPCKNDQERVMDLSQPEVALHIHAAQDPATRGPHLILQKRNVDKTYNVRVDNMEGTCCPTMAYKKESVANILLDC
jgi:hypothetical protein